MSEAVVPEGWKEYVLSDMASLVKGVTYTSSGYCDSNSGLPFITIKCIVKNGGFSHRGLKFYKGKYKENQMLKAGDVVFSNTDLTRNGDIVGSPLKMPDLGLGNNILFSMDLSKVIPEEDKIIKNYLYFWLMQDYVKRFMVSYSAGSTVLHLNTASVNKIRGCIPPLPEQQKIASILTAVDEVIEKTEARISKLHYLKKGMMQELLTKGIGHTEFKDSPVGRVPVEWDAILLDRVAARVSGHTPSKSHPEYWNGGIKWVSLSDSSKLDKLYISKTGKEISKQGISNSSAVLHPKGTVIISRDAGIGKSAILKQEMAVSQHFMAWICGEILDKYYLYYLLQMWKPRFESIAMGSTIKTIGLSYFRNLKIPLPPIKEQKKISNSLLSVEKTIFSLMDSLIQKKSLKKALMQDLLTGKVRVKTD